MPRFGTAAELTAAQVWAAAARTLTDFSAEEIFDLPIYDDIYSATNVTTSATANTYGSWAQISADIGVGKRLLAATIRNNTVSACDPGEIEFGEGASGSEAAVARLLFDVTGLHIVHMPLWKSLSDNARLSARAKSNNASAIELYVTLLVA